MYVFNERHVQFPFSMMIERELVLLLIFLKVRSAFERRAYSELNQPSSLSRKRKDYIPHFSFYRTWLFTYYEQTNTSKFSATHILVDDNYRYIVSLQCNSFVGKTDSFSMLFLSKINGMLHI